MAKSTKSKKKAERKAPPKKSSKTTEPKKAQKRTPNGRTLKTADKYLPVKKGKEKELKDKRWVAVIDSNERNELAVVRLTTQKQKNTTSLPNYKMGNKQDTYFKHFVETKDNEGKPIKASKTGKFQENSSKYDLNTKQVALIKEKTLNHSKQVSENKRKINELKNKKR